MYAPSSPTYCTWQRTRLELDLDPPPPRAHPGNVRYGETSPDALQRTADNPPTEPRLTNSGGLDIVQQEADNGNKNSIYGLLPLSTFRRRPPLLLPPRPLLPFPSLCWTKRGKGQTGKGRRDCEIVAYLYTDLTLIKQGRRCSGSPSAFRCVR